MMSQHGWTEGRAVRLRGKLQHFQNFVLFSLVVVIEGLLQVVADANIIHHKSLILRGAAHAVHASDCLEKSVRDDDLVEIHHLFHRRIEAGEQHVVHDHDPYIARDSFILAIESAI